MECVIEIETDESSKRLYEVTAKSLEFHTKHLNNVKEWMRKLKKLKADYPSSVSVVDYNSLQSILEFNGLLNISTLDLAVVIRQLVIAKDNWEQLFFAKHAYAIIYETIESYKKFNKIVTTLINEKANNLSEEYKALSIELKDFKKNYQYDSVIYNVRNKVASHIEDFQLYFSTLYSIDILLTKQAVPKFINILNKLQDISTSIVNIINEKMAEDPIHDLFSQVKNI